jgi:hypothetical protein
VFQVQDHMRKKSGSQHRSTPVKIHQPQHTFVSTGGIVFKFTLVSRGKSQA